MALMAVNDAQDRDGLLAQAAALPAGAPIVVMIHGYRYRPGAPDRDPHRHILSLAPDPHTRRVVSWPAGLGFTADGPEGLAVALGWPADGGLRSAYARASDVGAELASLIDRLAVTARRPVALIGHSLGARVALAALCRAAPGTVGRLVLLAAAELRDRADAAIASPAGLLAEVINVTSRENDPFDLGFELILTAGRGRALGFGLSQPRRNWVDVQIDDPATRAGLAALGFTIDHRPSRACHWSPYMAPGVFELYRAALAGPDRLPLRVLRATLPDHPAPRWSRLLGARAQSRPAPVSLSPAA